MRRMISCAWRVRCAVCADWQSSALRTSDVVVWTPRVRAMHGTSVLRAFVGRMPRMRFIASG